MELQDSPNKLSRRNWLRDAAIAATSVTVVPSFFIGCTDHRIDPGNGGLGASLGSEPTLEELRMAAQNLQNMRRWLEKLHGRQVEYELGMYLYLKGGKERPSSWTDFIVNIVLDIVVGVIGAAAAAAETATAGAASAGIIAALALTTELVKKFTSKDLDGNLEGVIAEFMDGQRKLYDKLDSALILMATDDDNYKNLKEAFKGGAIQFNGKPYTLSDLAKADFPTIEPVVHNGNLFVDLQDAAMLQFKKYFWYVMIVKAGEINVSSSFWPTIFYGQGVTDFGRDWYKDESNKSRYLRGYYSDFYGAFRFNYRSISFDGRELSAAAANELFKDDTPEHIINSTGLFNRAYVYKYFRRNKDDFNGYYELKKDTAPGPGPGANCIAFDCTAEDDYNFTGGDFPMLVKLK